MGRYLVVTVTEDGAEHRPSTGSRSPYRTRVAAENAVPGILSYYQARHEGALYPSAASHVVGAYVVDAAD